MTTINDAQDPSRSTRRGVRFALWLTGISSLLLIPLVAMRLTDEVAWTASDFLVAAALLALAACAMEWSLQRSGSVAYRIATALAIAAALLIVWATLSVGIVGDESHPANGLYIAVVVLAAAAGVALRARPRGLAVLAAVVALLLAAAAGGAIVLGQALLPAAASGVFAVVFLVAAVLYARASASGETGAGSAQNR